MKLFVTTLCGLASAGCSDSDKFRNQLTCDTECEFTNVGRTLRRTFYSQNSWTYLVVGTENNVDVAQGDYRQLLTFDGKNCGEDILDALSNREFGIEVHDRTKGMMTLEAQYIGHHEKCWKSRNGLFMQLRKDASNVEQNRFDFMNKSRKKDFYYLQFLGVQRAVNQLGIDEAKLHQCFSKANVKRLDYNGKATDHTKCLSYTLCEKEFDWGPDATAKPTTSAATTKATTKSTTTEDTVDPTVKPTDAPGPEDLPDYNNMNYTFSCDGSDCQIQMENGFTFLGTESQGVVTFKSIPYAQPPIGDLRWKSPVSVFEYDEIVDASGPAKKCMTLNAGGNDSFEDYSEDCLYLNIQVKKTVLENKERRPIVYFIHGGGFNGGSGQGNYKNAVLNQDVTMVGVNYRLGPWGFLQLDELEDGQIWRGNWGLQDQVAGMKWMNVFGGVFGGEKDNLTIIGASAGSESCWRHFTTPHAWPYFTRVAATGIGLMAGSKSDGRVTKKLTNAVFANAACDDAAAPLDCLRGKTSQELQSACDEATNAIRNDNVAMALNSGFAPVHTSDYFTATLVDDIANGNYKKNTDVLWTYSKDEAWGMARGFFTQHINQPGTLMFDWKTDINNAKDATGFKVPSPWPNTLFEKLFGSNFAASLNGAYQCPADGDCEEQLTKFVVGTQWVCSTRYALQNSWPSNDAKLWAVQYEEPSCQPVDGILTKACHGAEGAAVLGGLSGRSDYGNRVTKAYKEFFHTGWTSELEETSGNNLQSFNRISEDNWSVENIAETMYDCDALDQIHADKNWYNWGISATDGDDSHSMVENTRE